MKTRKRFVITDMFKHHNILGFFLTLAITFLGLSGLISTPSHAELIDNGGGLIYDTELDITWAQYRAQTPLSWDDAKTFASELELGGVDGWRLPYISVQAGADPVEAPVDCSQASFKDCQDNELGYMFYVNLGGTKGETITESGDPDLVLFPDLNPYIPYWTGSESSRGIWNFNFDGGTFEDNNRATDPYHVWAVHEGNVDDPGSACTGDDDCDDGVFCNGAEVCEGGGCLSGPLPCAGGEVCVEESQECNAYECQQGFECDDGVFCNGAETCDNNKCVAGTNPCEATSRPVCVEETQTCIDPQCSVDTDCDDGRYCNGEETCDADAGLCQDGTSPCEGDDICLEETDECVAPECTENADCDDSRFCNGDETCDAGRCQDGTSPCVAGDEVCVEIIDECVEAECIFDFQCDDGRFCNGNETCDAGQCQSENTSPCGAGESCEESTDQCVETPGKATLISPSGTLTENNPTYTWNAVANSTWYYLWVNASNQEKRILKWYKAADAGCGGGTGECSVTPSTKLADGAAKWWIQTWNEFGEGPWSAGMSFTMDTGTSEPPGKATLISPSGTITENSPTYTWNAVENSTWYYLWVNDSTQEQKILQWYTAAVAGCGDGTGDCSVTPATELADGAAEWWIQTWDEFGTGPWSAALSITVDTSGE